MLGLSVVIAIASVAFGLPWEQAESAERQLEYQLPRFDHTLANFEEAWAYFRNSYSKKYPNNEEEDRRKKIFRNNVEQMKIHNYQYEKGHTSFRKAVNKFTDMEHSEFLSTMTGCRKTKHTRNARDASQYDPPLSRAPVPESWDWRPQGCVTAVKNQGDCGSCWAFSATGALEAQHFLSSGKFFSLSEQQLVDCSLPWWNEGCGGGLEEQAFQYLNNIGGIESEESYPYTANDSICHFNSAKVAANCTGYVTLESGDEDYMKKIVYYTGPISIAFDASYIFDYSEGVYIDNKCRSENYNLNHAMLVVGYGTTHQGQDYWIVKNSWGRDWGDEGYLYTARNRHNQCGIATDALFPLVNNLINRLQK